MNRFFRIFVGHTLQLSEHIDFHAQFLAQLPGEALLGRFARLAFAAGKFPQPAEVILMATLGDEQLAAVKDKRGADLDGFMICDMRFTI